MVIRLRKMEQPDVEAVHAIEQVTSDDPWTIKIFTDCLAVGYKCFVFEEDSDSKKDSENKKEIVGYGLLSIEKDKKISHVLNVTIREDKRGLGLGKKMMYHLLRIAKNKFSKKVRLEVKISNQIAIDLYKKLGFNQINIKEGYYPLPDGTHEDALEFELDLKK